MNYTRTTSLSPMIADESNETYALEVLLADTERRIDAQRPSPPLGTQVPGVIIGRLVGFSASGEPLIQLPEDGGKNSRPARSAIVLDRRHVAAEVVLTFENGDRDKPIILGLLSATGSTPTALEVTADEDRLELTADREIVLRCGRASITLTRAGKVLIRGAYVLSRSSGANRIKGGSVQIN
jgi:hypothetical protein